MSINLMLSKVNMFIPGSKSLKDRRMVLNSIKDKVKNTYNVLVKEEQNNDNRQKTILYFVSISNKRDYLHDLHKKITSFLIQNYDIQIRDEQIDIIKV